MDDITPCNTEYNLVNPLTSIHDDMATYFTYGAYYRFGVSTFIWACERRSQQKDFELSGRGVCCKDHFDLSLDQCYPHAVMFLPKR